MFKTNYFIHMSPTIFEYNKLFNFSEDISPFFFFFGNNARLLHSAAITICTLNNNYVSLCKQIMVF